MKNYSIIEANVTNNREDIFPILKRNLQGASAHRYKWNYENCPYGKARCLLAKDDSSGSYVGSAALFPRKIMVKGELMYCGIAADFAVDKKHRAFGPAIKIQREIQSKMTDFGFRFIYGIPNELSKTLFLRLEHKEIGKFERFIKILKTEYKSKQYLPFTVHFKMFSRVIDFFIKFFSKENMYKKQVNYSVEMPIFFDNRFDLLWEKVSNQFDIVGERTSDFLNWRYKRSAYQGYKIFCIIDKKKEIAGYIVYFFEDNMCHIVDILFVMVDDVLDKLFTEFFLFLRTNSIGSVSIRYLGKGLLEKKLKEFNFHIVKKEENYVIIYSPNFSSESFLLDKKNWYFFQGDNDI
jgi:hypothetical protein